MVADLHAHYAMHLVPEDEPGTVELMSTAARRPRQRDRLRASIVGLLQPLRHYASPASEPRVTLPSRRAGDLGVVLSVLYSPFDEMDLEQHYGAPPMRRLPRYARPPARARGGGPRRDHAGSAAVARSPAELDQVLAPGKVAFVHCVEGGFHLGETPAAVDRAVTQLARRGVAYVTLAHLFWRRVATNAPAIPFLPDWLYRLLSPSRGRVLRSSAAPPSRQWSASAS